jgi:hypothetical protein
LTLSSLGDINKDYGITEFSVNLSGEGVNLAKSTVKASSITGMIIAQAYDNYIYLSAGLFIIILALFIKMNVFKNKKQVNK